MRAGVSVLQAAYYAWLVLMRVRVAASPEVVLPVPLLPDPPRGREHSRVPRCYELLGPCGRARPREP